jgi:hypothetical protein
MQNQSSHLEVDIALSVVPNEAPLVIYDCIYTGATLVIRLDGGVITLRSGIHEPTRAADRATRVWLPRRPLLSLTG